MPERLSLNQLRPYAVPVVGALLLAAAYWHTFVWFAGYWFGNKDYYHCPAVPAVVAWLLWRRRRTILKVRAQPAYAGLAVLAFGLLVHLLGARTGIRVVSAASLPISAAGLVYALGGAALFRETWIAYPVSFFMVPVPHQILAQVGMPMQNWSAAAAAVMGKGLGLDVIREGIVLLLHGDKFVVAQQCSGINSLLALSLVSIVVVHLLAAPLWRKIVLLLLVPPIVLAANSIRVASVLVVAEFLSPKVALDMFIHGFSDIIVYMAALMLLVLIAGILSGGRAPSLEPES